MKAREFKEGDIVKIRQWDDMEEEFGTGLYGDIDCMCIFTKEMKMLCGREAEVLYPITGRTTVQLRFLDGTRYKPWVISTDMIELVKTEESEEIIDVEPEELQPVKAEADDTTRLLDELGGLF